jgi:hypothetical protein
MPNHKDSGRKNLDFFEQKRGIGKKGVGPLFDALECALRRARPMYVPLPLLCKIDFSGKEK